MPAGDAEDQRPPLAQQRVQQVPKWWKKGSKVTHSEAAVAGVGPPLISAWSELLA